MSVSTNLAVSYHQQDTDYYCGAACAQMVLDSIGAGLLDQDDLYADNHSHSTIDSGVNWATAPDGLQWTLNDRRPAGFGNYFALFALDTEDALSRKLCWTIHHYGVAPVALVYGWAHWITVRGYTCSAHPATSGDNSYSIDSFDVNNPWPPTPSFYTPSLAPPPLHSGSDGCGGGGVDRGIADEHITYATWQADYMDAVPGGHWSGKFVAVCDPEPPSERGGARQAPRARESDGRELLSAKRAASLAMKGLERHGLMERKEWARGLKDARAEEPLLVQRLDRLDSYYYLVPLARRKDTAALVSVDARFGDYRQSALLPRARHGRAFISADEAYKLIVGRRIDLGEDRGRVLARKEVVCRCAHLVWRPCRESLSPYYPFYLFAIGAHRLYVRVDGAVFSSLTLGMKGI